MTRPLSTPLSTSPAAVRSTQSQHRLKSTSRFLTRWAPLTALVSTTAYVAAAHPLFFLATTYGYYWRP